MTGTDFGMYFEISIFLCNLSTQTIVKMEKSKYAEGEGGDFHIEKYLSMAPSGFATACNPSFLMCFVLLPPFLFIYLGIYLVSYEIFELRRRNFAFQLSDF